MIQIPLESPLDMHLHLRDDEMLSLVAPLSARSFSGGLIMPNLLPPVKTKEEVIAYKKRILERISGTEFTPYMTIFFHKELNYEILKELKSEILAIKMYPDGVTTNSVGGVKSIDLNEIGHIFEAMQVLKIPLCIHGETNDFVMDREKNFMPIYLMLAKTYPDLKIIMEHITTKELSEALDTYKNLFATITVHHLLITLDDVLGGLLNPHLFCKPIAKRPEDRTALLKLALSGHPKVMFGSDSAPHPQDKKEAHFCSAGVFTAPIALALLVELFDAHNKLDNLQSFISKNAQRIYEISPAKKIVLLDKKEFIIPERYGKDLIPFRAGQSISWTLQP